MLNRFIHLCFIVGSLTMESGIAAPQWEKPSLFLGSLDLDGGLRQRFQLGVLAGSPEFSFPVYLEHGFRVDEPVTEYKIPQLETYVAPEGRDQISWLEPGGIQHLFKTSELMEKAPERQKEPWVAINVGSGNYDFISNDGWTYHYQGGAIVSLRAPTGRDLKFETEGLRIRRIYQEAGGKQITLLEANENDLGQPENLRIGPDRHEFKYAGDTDQLASWHSPQMGKSSVSFSYSPEKLVNAVTLPSGEKLTYVWGGTDGAWQKESGLHLPEIGRSAFLAADADFKFQYGISKAGVNLLRTDALGIKEGFAYNPKTRQILRWSRDGGEVTEFFGVRGASQNRLESARDARGREAIRLTYDEQGRVVTKQVPGQASMRFEYDALDRIVKIFRLEDLTKSYEYEGNTQKPVKITNALGDAIEMSYHPDGQIKTYKNLNGAVYEFLYDDLGQLIEERHPMGYKKTIERDAFGRITRVKSLEGRETRYEYTGENRLAAVQEHGSNWSYEYDPDGQLTRLLKDGRTWQKTEYEKNAETGETVLRNTDFKGDETVLQFDKNGNIVKQVDALGQETKYKHNALGQLTGWEDQRGSAADLERDSEGRISGVATGEWSKLEMAYDLTGRIRKKNNGEQNIQYLYDKDGRLIQIDYGKGQTIDYVYDSYGRVLTAMTGQGVKTSYSWDSLDRKTSERNDIPGIGFTLLKWTYTPSGRTRTVAIYKNGEDKTTCLQETGYEYDDLGRYTRITVNGEPKVWYEYDPATLLLSRKRFFNGWVICYEHYDTGYPKSLVTTNGDGKTIKDVHYVWNAEGKLQKRIMDGILQEYRYDPLGRLTEVTTP